MIIVTVYLDTRLIKRNCPQAPRVTQQHVKRLLKCSEFEACFIVCLLKGMCNCFPDRVRSCGLHKRTEPRALQAGRGGGLPDIQPLQLWQVCGEIQRRSGGK